MVLARNPRCHLLSCRNILRRRQFIFVWIASATPRNNVRDERGSAIWFLFLGVALFGALAYIFLQGSRSNVSMITDEAQKTAAYRSQDCSNSANLATKRLQMRGCGDLISLEADGSNPHAGAPTDGSCSVFHPNGGGAKSCSGSTSVAECGTPAIGSICPDGTIYAGLSEDGNVPMYTTPSDAGLMPYNNGNTTGYVLHVAVDFIRGAANTLSLVTTDSDSATSGSQPHRAALYCYCLGKEATGHCADNPTSGAYGHGKNDWYLPSMSELFTVCDNRVAIGGFDLSGNYFLSNYRASLDDSGVADADIIEFSPSGCGWGGGASKPHNLNVRCVRKGN